MMDVSKEKYEFWLNEVRKFIPIEQSQEVLQEVLSNMLERGFEPAEADTYVIASCYKAYYTTTSPYARKYNKHIINVPLDGYDRSDVEITDFDKLDIIKYINEMPDIAWWERQAFLRKILEGKTFKELAKEYGLEIYQVVYSFYKVKNILREKLQNEYF